jgi:aldehyde dehydrogenase (NAD+)
MTVAQEEIFGPVLCIIPADSDEQAIEIANGTPFGLNSAVFTNDVDRALQVARRMRSGNVGHNGYRVDTNITFGGVKQSGLGREGGRDGLLSYLEAKTILLSGVPSKASPAR